MIQIYSPISERFLFVILERMRKKLYGIFLMMWICYAAIILSVSLLALSFLSMIITVAIALVQYLRGSFVK
ncbi:hypothetical protein RH08_03195 [Candidatus Liberibacter asiaticus]|uniref:Uncharacterized protein n=2 Tax=Liberibacter asiaticus TaxID=34021 RepID=C6XF88_LIBAP|nr:hypothetical protein CLIBASIA_02275 [Candidatus Liberibacter asiaticus str. psy62]AGH16994.1 hypothetical protein WSI_03120 [Candidatus Liberibacter asiaticus str. gxpsy]ALK07329.1 hypothetical protein CD16_03155 [Candidatus Liberibacter asiaticus]BAP26514.1 hypothetical protein CGUJ_02275 [Candidatus Liberibacter asiaticus str. Ishi-1]ASK52820.1 hypothetical protein B2I23_03200 [Candidatus Liberibacter asiaticus]